MPSVYNNVNNMGGNPMAMLMLTVIIVVYYIVFASLGVNMGPSQRKKVEVRLLLK